MLPNYLIIGASRSGTTWLSKNIMLHPEIFMHSKKELHFFDKDYDKGIDWYEQKFNDVNVKVVGEGTPAYLYFEHVSELIKKHMPDTKLIVSLRDPVDRAHSHYLYRERERERKSENIQQSFEQKIEATPRLIEIGLYAKKLQKYYDVFPKENILVILYDELKNDPEQYLKKVYKFLGVNTEFRSPLIENRINSASSKSGKFYVLHLLSKILVKTGFFRAAESVLSLNKKDEIKSVSKETREMLLEKYYLDDIEKLEEMIQMDLSEWKKV